MNANEKVALVTGANGLMGTHLLSELVSRNIRAVTLGRQQVNGFKHYQINGPLDINGIRLALKSEQPDYLFHLAGSFKAKNYQELLEVNAYYGKHILDCLLALGFENQTKIIWVGSASEYGQVKIDNLPITEECLPRPLTDYGKSKLVGSRIALAWSTESRTINVVRPFNILGPGISKDLSIGNFSQQLIKSKSNKAIINTGYLGTSRDFIDAIDCANIMCELVINPRCKGQVINLCSGQPVKIADILDYLIEKSGKKAIVKDTKQMGSSDIKTQFGCTKKREYFSGITSTINWKTSVNRILLETK